MMTPPMKAREYIKFLAAGWMRQKIPHPAIFSSGKKFFHKSPSSNQHRLIPRRENDPLHFLVQNLNLGYAVWP